MDLEDLLRALRTGLSGRMHMPGGSLGLKPFLRDHEKVTRRVLACRLRDCRDRRVERGQRGLHAGDRAGRCENGPRVVERQEPVKLQVARAEHIPKIFHRLGVGLGRKPSSVADHRVQGRSGGMERIRDGLDLVLKCRSPLRDGLEMREFPSQMVGEGFRVELGVENGTGRAIVEIRGRSQQGLAGNAIEIRRIPGKIGRHGPGRRARLPDRLGIRRRQRLAQAIEIGGRLSHGR